MSELRPGQQKVGRGPTAVTMEKVADRVWLMRGGFPHRVMNVYFLEEDGGGVTVFDAGIKDMAPNVAHVGEKMGGIRRIVLGHAHGDHRGAAPAQSVPVWCHEDEAQYAEGDGGHSFFDYSKLPVLKPGGRYQMPLLVEKMWDGGPVHVAGTLAEGDEVAGFRVVHFPGHAHGQIGLWRESDRVALVSDTIYTLDPLTGEFGEARVPHPAFNYDQELAKASVRKLAALDPAVVWAGHADPVTQDVRAALERAAAAA